ncbi:chemotaxis protein CheX [Nitrospira sp. M1]
MQFLEQEILEITETTWQSLLGFEIHVRQVSSIPRLTESPCIGFVSISGEWNGVVLLQGSDPLTKSAAAVIFGKDLSAVTHDDQRDVLYELTNIIAGNMKSLLPSPCQLSLPIVLLSPIMCCPVSGLTRISALCFDCQGQPMYVSVWQEP